ncbi:MAG: hypothetical protein R2776_09095 [Flavobacteriaceae bacterium]
MKSNKKYTHGLKTPPSYFNTLEEDIFIKIAEEKLPNDLGFKVPSGYFNSLETQLLIEIPTKKEPTVISLFSKKNLGYAAGIAAILFIALFVVFTPKTNTLDAIQTSEIEAYVSNGNIDLYTQDIAQLLTEDDLESLQIEETVFFSEENLETYLLETINDTSLLIE